MCKNTKIKGPVSTQNEIKVSVVMPVLNEEKYIEKCILSLLEQDYQKSDMEWIFMDGESKDSTVAIIQKFQEKYPSLMQLINNPNKTVPYAMNIGIRNAKGKYIVRLDAHATYNCDYISKCVYYLENTDAVNVGGILETRGKEFMGKTIARMLSSRFGVGGSQFRVSSQSGYVDTVPFGAFKREIFDEVGCYDERLTRNEDNELNYRIRKRGYKIYLANDINLSYYCRDTIGAITKMAHSNGKWTIVAMKLSPGSMGIRHFIPLMFVLSLLFLVPLSYISLFALKTLIIELTLYGLLDFLFACKQAESIKSFLLLLLLFPIFHVSYGFGSLTGILKLYKY